MYRKKRYGTRRRVTRRRQRSATVWAGARQKKLIRRSAGSLDRKLLLVPCQVMEPAGGKRQPPMIRRPEVGGKTVVLRSCALAVCAAERLVELLYTNPWFPMHRAIHR